MLGKVEGTKPRSKTPRRWYDFADVPIPAALRKIPKEMEALIPDAAKSF